MKQLEAREQIQVIEYCQYIPLLREHIYHIPNGGRRNPQEAKKLKAMGVRPGVLDLHLPLPIMHRPLLTGESHGLYIEMKAGKNGLTDNQIKFFNQAQANGYECYECNGSGEAIEVLTDYITRLKKARCE